MALTKIDDRGLKTPIDLLDNEKIRLGTGNDFEIYFNGTNTSLYTNTGDITIQTAGDDIELLANDDIKLLVAGGAETSVNCIGHGAVELYHDNFKAVETDTNGLIVNGPEGDYAGLFIKADEGDDNGDKWFLKALASSSTFQILSRASGSWETSIECNGDGNVELYYDNSKKLETNSTGVHVTGMVTCTTEFRCDDNEKFVAGTGQDLQIYHDGTNSYLANTTGSLYILPKSGENGIQLVPDGTVKLYYDNAAKFETTSTGAKISGTGASFLEINSTDGTVNPMVRMTNGDRTWDAGLRGDTNDSYVIRDHTASASRLIIDSSGKIGIGLTNPVNNLDVSGSVSATGNQLNTAYADGVYIGTNGGLPAITAGKASTSAFAPLVFRQDHQAAGAERMRIVSEGEVGINITNPEAYGTNGHGYKGLTVQAPSGNYSGITIKSAYNGGGGLMFSDGSGSTAELYNVALTADHINKRLNFYVDGSVVCRLSQHGLHPNPTDSGAANALDDYEEGQWTPQLHDGSISYQEAYYTKIGRQVTITARIYNISDNSTNDAVRIKNLPFAANVTGVAAGSIFYSYCGQQHATVLYMDSTHSGSLNMYGGYSGAHDHVRHNELNVSSGTTDMYLIATYFAAT